MPIINGIKFACNSCIKGHRSSHCNHVERPLFEIRRKGRPVTQCAYCRDLRKTKQVHVKCVCSERRADTNSHHPHINNNNIITTTSTSSSQSQQGGNNHNSPAVTISLSPGMTGQRLNPGPAEPNRFLETTLTPDCPTSTTTTITASTIATLPPVQQNDDSFSWAWVRPNNIGYVFQKPPTPAPLDHQQQPPHSLPTTATTSPPSMMDLDAAVAQMTETNAVSIASLLSTPPPSSTSQSLPPPQPPQQHPLQQPSVSSASTSLPLLPPMHQQPQLQQQQPRTPTPAPTPVVSCCGSFASSTSCQPSNGQSESVVITITPLPKQQHDQVTTTTRVVTCYCGPTCVCPGCLVHPANAFLDPYAGLYPMQQQSSSSASSTCGSDDD